MSSVNKAGLAAFQSTNALRNMGGNQAMTSTQDERANLMADKCEGDPWELLGYFREKLRQATAESEDWKAKAMDLRLASLPAPDTAGWIVANGSGTAWRTWNAMGSTWTNDRDRATRYARREDAELVHAEDEDAWLVQPYSAKQAPDTAGEVVLWVSPGQLAQHTDPVRALADPHIAGNYIPARKTPGGKFTMPLYAAPQASATGERTELAKLIETRLLGVDPMDQDLQLDDDDWRLILAALNPTAAEGGES